MSPHEIYEYLTNGPGTRLLDDAQAAARAEWTKEDGRAELIRKQAELIRGGWQGSAADGAFGAAQPLAKSALDGTDRLSSAEDLLDRQSGSFHRAANSVRPVPQAPPKLDMLDAMVALSDYEKDVKSYQADAQHNIEVFRGYDNASEYNQTNIPKQYTIVSHSGSTISVTQDDGQRDDTGTYIDSVEYQQPRDGNESGTPSGPGSPGGTPAGGTPAGGSPVGGSVSGAQPQQTSPSNFAPPPTTTPTPLPPSTVQPAPTGITPGGLVPGLPVGGYSSGGPGARSGGFGGPGSGGTGSGGPGSSGRGGTGAGVRGLGAGSGVGALAAEEQAAVRRASAAAATRGGAMAGAPIGAGRGKGDEDEEHQRKVLIEIDAEGVFGSDILTAPQVIGDDDYEDD
jgi:hypothetical protein